MNLKDLAAPFPAAEIEWRVGSTSGDKTKGLALAYLTARHVMDRLDDMCGPENWQDRYEFHGARTICYLSIRVNDEWITKADGAGDSDVEAEKGAISDALKRAAVKFGIGRYLYDLGNVWVELEPAGRSYKIKRDQYAKLERELNKRFGEAVKSVSPTQQPEPKQEPAVDHQATFTRLSQANAKLATLDEFNKFWKQGKVTAAFDSLPDQLHSEMRAKHQDKAEELMKLMERAAMQDDDTPAGYRPPSFDNLEK